MDKLSIGSQSYVAKLRRSGSKFILNLDEETYEGNFSRKNRGLIQINLEGVNSIGFSERKGNEIYVHLNGINYVIRQESTSTKQTSVEEESDDVVLSPITGKLLDRKVEDGDKVRKDDVIIILEAMKMENILSSPVDGIVKEIKVNPQQTVEKNNILIKFKP